MLDLIPLIIIAICVIFGAYRGFLVTTIKAGIFLLSALMAFFMYPIFTAIFGGNDILELTINYTEGQNYITSVTTADNINLPNEDVSQYSEAQIDEIVARSTLPFPYNERVKQTMKERTYEQYGIKTVSEYFNQTVAITAINICSYIVTFIILCAIFTFLINLIDYARPLPILKRNDTFFGGLVGFLCGYFICYVFFAATPVILSLANVNEITKFILQSSTVDYFYGSNFILNRIRPTM